jgi:hypothetical protein
MYAASAPSGRSNSCIYDLIFVSPVPSSQKMTTSNTAPSPIQGVCYFSIQHNKYSSYNDETPLTSPFTPPGENIVSDPSNPLLAFRPCMQSRSTNQTRPGMESLLQLQTQAAHIPPPRRPQPQPLQNVLAVSDDYSDDSSSDQGNTQAPMELARCSRCHRSQSIDMSTGKAANMVAYGLNSFYCLRCANITGFLQRP